MGQLKIDNVDHFTINKIYKNPDDFFINKTYQRSGAWDEKKHQKLLDSIFSNLSIGVFFLKKHNDGKFEIIDGQQRIETIKKFLRNELRTGGKTKIFSNKNFKELEAETDIYSTFMAFKLWYIPVREGNDEELSDIFLRLQEGQPLNKAERLNAIQSPMRKFIIDISNHKKFGELKIQPYRFAHRYIAAQYVWHELNFNFSKEIFKSLPRYPELENMYLTENVSKTLHKKVFGNLDFIINSLGQHLKIIGKKSDLVLLYLFALYIRKKYIIDSNCFKTFITNFFTEVAISKTSEEKIEDLTPYQKYNQLRKAGSTVENFKGRFDILLKDFKDSRKYFKIKDANRFFNEGQKLFIYYKKDKEICSYCKKHVEWKDASFDHIKRIEEGGKTTINNGRLVHSGKCHAELEKQKKQ